LIVVLGMQELGNWEIKESGYWRIKIPVSISNLGNFLFQFLNPSIGLIKDTLATAD